MEKVGGAKLELSNLRLNVMLKSCERSRNVSVSVSVLDQKSAVLIKEMEG